MRLPYDELDKKLVDYLNNAPLGLGMGKMGFCLYFFILSRKENRKDFQETANYLLDDICEHLSQEKNIDLKFGLAGIGLGIYFLIKRKYIKGNINIVLEDIDNAIFKALTSSIYGDVANMDILTLVHLLYYWYFRITEQKEGSEAKWLYTEISISLINKLSDRIDNKFCESPIRYNVDYKVPLFLHVLSLYYSLNIHSSKIKMILDEFRFILYTTIPFLNANKLYLLWSLYALEKTITINGLENYIDMVKRSLNIDSIFNDEIKDKNIFFFDGIISIYLILERIKFSLDDYDFEKYKTLSISKIKRSSVWEFFVNDPLYIKNNIGLFGGYCGLSLFKRML
jgi:lantibiotic modifying enzyme